MTKFVVRRLLLILIALLLVNFLGFAYAHYAKPLRAAQTPYQRVEEATPVLPAYKAYLGMVFNLDFSSEVAVPGSARTGPVAMGKIIWSATKASAGLLGIVLLISGILGFILDGILQHLAHRFEWRAKSL